MRCVEFDLTSFGVGGGEISPDTKATIAVSVPNSKYMYFVFRYLRCAKQKHGSERDEGVRSTCCLYLYQIFCWIPPSLYFAKFTPFTRFP